MAFLRDLRLIQEATEIPALREVVREALVRALFVRDERALPKDVVRVLTRGPDAVLAVREEIEVREAVRIANGEETTVNLGRPADEFHFYRSRLAVGKDQEWGVTTAPRRLLTYDWIVPPQGGLRIDLSAMNDIELDGVNYAARVGTGATWKAFYDRAKEVGMMPAVFPAVPLDFAVGDAIVGDAPFRSYGSSFRSAVYDVRGLAANGLRVNCGYEFVPNYSTGYNLKDLAVQFGNEFLVPTNLWLRLLPRPPGLTNLAFGFDDAASLATGMDNLVATGRPWTWVHASESRSWDLLGRGDSPAPFVLEVGVGGTEALLASRTKALETALAGFTAKGEVPPPWDATPEAYASRSETLNLLLFVGEVVTRTKHAAAVMDAIQAVGASKDVRSGFFASVRDSGQVYLAPHFEAAKEPAQTYELSRSLADRLQRIPDTHLDSRLAMLWDTETYYMRRLAILQKLEGALDMANAIEPPAVLAPDDVDLFPGEQA